MDSTNTLSNVKNPGDHADSPCANTMIGTIPEVQNAQTGVSVKYVRNADYLWFVLRASYGREDKALNFFINKGIYAYVAKHYVWTKTNGKQRKVLKSLIPNLIFVYTTLENIKNNLSNTPEGSFLSFYYNHFVRDDQQHNPPLTVSCKEMENFILATISHNEHILLVHETQCHYKKDEQVRVIDGPFRGVEGKVARVLGQQRVVVALTNIGLISTAYVPTAFLQKIHLEI